MNLIRKIWTKLRSLWQRREVKQEIDEELRSHLEQRTAENIAAEMAPDEAAREARKRFGNMQGIREECRERRGVTAMPWYDQGVYDPPGAELLGHGGGTAGASTFIGLDTRQHRGVVVLSNQQVMHATTIGWAILQRMPLTRASGTRFVREMVGIGTVLDLNQQTHALRITQVLPQSPAAQAGLSASLIIQKIENVNVQGKSLAECLALLHGEIGARVRLELVNSDRGVTNTVELTRGKFLSN